MSAKTCFVIAPIGDPESDTRKRSDQVLKHIIRPAVESVGYKAIRADEISEPGLITSQVIQHIVDDPLVVADLTERNPNVFYELALRHAIRRPLVQLIGKGEHIPFDVAGMRTIPVNHRDLDSVEEAKQEIAKQVRALEATGANVESPISVALELQTLRQSDNPEQRSLADLLAAVADLRTAVSGIEVRLSDPASLLPRAYLRHVMRTLPPDYDQLRNYLTHSREPAILDELRRALETLERGRTLEERFAEDLDRPAATRKKEKPSTGGEGGA